MGEVRAGRCYCRSCCGSCIIAVILGRTFVFRGTSSGILLGRTHLFFIRKLFRFIISQQHLHLQPELIIIR
jgi:hypothetical protein